MSANTRLERLLMWLATAILGGYGSPSLACLCRRPTLRWVWSGLTDHAAPDPTQFARYCREICWA